MGRFVLFYSALVFFVDAVLLAIYVRWYFIFISFLTSILFYIIRKVSPKDSSLSNLVGLALGMGVDLENPDQPKKLPVVLEENALDLGFLGIGGPGSGKSIGSIVMISYYTKERNIGWVYWEGKGDIDIYQKNVDIGSVPDKFFSTELPYSDTTNVVSGPAETVMDALTQTLITTDNVYYQNVQREALSIIVRLLKSCGKPIILRDIYVALKMDSAGLYVIELAQKANAPADVIEMARQFYGTDPADRANDIKGLLTNLSLFVTGSIADRLNAYEPTLDLFEASKTGQRVYMHMPYTMLSKDISILFTEQIGVIAKNRQLYEKTRNPWPQIYDDWGKFFYSNVGPITARCRSAKMPVSYLFQSKGQTDSVDNTRIFTTEVMDNIGGFFVFRINGYDTAEWAARQFGTYETTELSATENSSYAGQSYSSRENPRVRADTLKGLNAGECFISCLASGEGGRSENKRYKARFPYPSFNDPDSIEWPVIKSSKNNDDCVGLHLWRDFMDKDRLEQLKKDVISAGKEKIEANQNLKADKVDSVVEDEKVPL